MNDRRILIAVAPSRFMRWHEQLRASLARRWPDAEVAFWIEPQEDRQSGSVTQLLALERILLRKSRNALSDRLDACRAPATLEPVADIVVDLLGDARPPARAAKTLRVLYDGRADDQAAVAALLSGAAPILEIEEAASGAILASGRPSLEAADGLIGGLEAVYSRVITLVERALAAPERNIEERAPRVERNPRGAAAFFMRNIAFQCARRIYHLCCHSPHWRVGWRFVDGPGVLETGGIAGARWRGMNDRELSFAADPFPIKWRGRSGVFYERLDYRTNIGEIYFQEFGAAGPVNDPVPALTEPWHLSYPFLIEHDDALYMAPEASASGGVMLYRCVEFPGKWEPVARLLDGVEAADATIFRHGGRYWMTSVVRDGWGGYSDTLVLHHAESIFGPWEPHPMSPVVVDSRFARPAGAVVIRNGALLRPVQDCSEGYGRRLVIMRIDQLDRREFRQTPVATIEPGDAWPGRRLHTINRKGRLECIDGAILAPKFKPLRAMIADSADARAANNSRARDEADGARVSASDLPREGSEFPGAF
jgi:hypothetical protein